MKAFFRSESDFLNIKEAKRVTYFSDEWINKKTMFRNQNCALILNLTLES